MADKHKVRATSSKPPGTVSLNGGEFSKGSVPKTPLIQVLVCPGNCGKTFFLRTIGYFRSHDTIQPSHTNTIY